MTRGGAREAEDLIRETLLRERGGQLFSLEPRPHGKPAPLAQCIGLARGADRRLLPAGPGLRHWEEPL